jgi:hypothetical protein
MAAITLSNAAASAKAQAVADLLDGGILRIYTTPTPSTADAAATGTLLAEFALASPAFGTPANGVMTAHTIAPTTAIADGSVAYWRAYESGSPEAVVCQGDAGTAGTSMIVNSTTVTSGGVVSILSWTYTQPKG